MDKIVIQGKIPLNGEVKISGSKNAALPIMSASLLTDEECIIKNVPYLNDVETMICLLQGLGKEVVRDKDELIIKTKKDINLYEASYDLVRKMRASICVLGPLLAKKRKASVSLPGGCIIGSRPVDLHIQGLSALGADIELKHGFITGYANKLKGKEIVLKGLFGSTVLGTANIMMAASLAEGRTTIQSAACEPEIVDLANFLKKMGANICGAGTPIIKIEGVSELKGAKYSIISDRIEAGTYLIAGAVTGGDITVKNVTDSHLRAVICKLKEAGQKITVGHDFIRIQGNINNIEAVDVVTSAFPGFPTDMQAQIMALLSIGKSISIISDKIYPDRFMHISELNRMGADIVLKSGSAVIKGVKNLTGTNVMASDLRASAALVLAGLAAEGVTEILRVYHLDRGYENIEEKLKKLGAKIKRIPEHKKLDKMFWKIDEIRRQKTGDRS